jgi:hypothetical protein
LVGEWGEEMSERGGRRALGVVGRMHMVVEIPILRILIADFEGRRRGCFGHLEWCLRAFGMSLQHCPFLVCDMQNVKLQLIERCLEVL